LVGSTARFTHHLSTGALSIFVYAHHGSSVQSPSLMIVLQVFPSSSIQEFRANCGCWVGLGWVGIYATHIRDSTIMAAPALSTPFQPYVYQSPQAVVTPFQIIGGEAQVLQIMLKSEEKVIARTGSMCYMSESMQLETIGPPDTVGNLLWQWFFGKTDTICT
jgi:hypothetical protein